MPEVHAYHRHPVFGHECDGAQHGAIAAEADRHIGIETEVEVLDSEQRCTDPRRVRPRKDDPMARRKEPVDGVDRESIGLGSVAMHDERDGGHVRPTRRPRVPRWRSRPHRRSVPR